MGHVAYGKPALETAAGGSWTPGKRPLPGMPGHAVSDWHSLVPRGGHTTSGAWQPDL